VLDTCVYIELDVIDPTVLPAIPEITAVTLAELHQGVVMAKNPITRAARMEKLGAAVSDFDPLPGTGIW
jgi:toxin FitB